MVLTGIDWHWLILTVWPDVPGVALVVCCWPVSPATHHHLLPVPDCLAPEHLLGEVWQGVGGGGGGAGPPGWTGHQLYTSQDGTPALTVHWDLGQTSWTIKQWDFYLSYQPCSSPAALQKLNMQSVYWTSVSAVVVGAVFNPINHFYREALRSMQFTSPWISKCKFDYKLKNK